MYFSIYMRVFVIFFAIRVTPFNALGDVTLVIYLTVLRNYQPAITDLNNRIYVDFRHK